MPTFRLSLVEQREFVLAIDAATLEEAKAEAVAAWDEGSDFQEFEQGYLNGAWMFACEELEYAEEGAEEEA